VAYQGPGKHHWQRARKMDGNIRRCRLHLPNETYNPAKQAKGRIRETRGSCRKEKKIWGEDGKELSGVRTLTEGLRIQFDGGGRLGGPVLRRFGGGRWGGSTGLLG